MVSTPTLSTTRKHADFRHYGGRLHGDMNSEDIVQYNGIHPLTAPAPPERQIDILVCTRYICTCI